MTKLRSIDHQMNVLAGVLNALACNLAREGLDAVATDVWEAYDRVESARVNLRGTTQWDELVGEVRR